jgi:hypothetical protein
MEGSHLMPALKYKDPGTGQWVLVPSVAPPLPTVLTGSVAWIASQTNWSVTGASYAVTGNLLAFTATNTGSAIVTGTAGGTGDIANTDIAQLNLAAIGVASLPFTQYLSSGPTGRMFSAVINAVGMVTIAATVPGTDIANGGTISLGGTVIVTPA